MLLQDSPYELDNEPTKKPTLLTKLLKGVWSLFSIFMLACSAVFACAGMWLVFSLITGNTGVL